MKPTSASRRYKPSLNTTQYKELMDRRWVDAYDICSLFRMERGALYNWCKASLLPYITIGRKKMFDMWEIDRMMEEKKQKG